MDSRKKTIIHWFRKGLRVHDNPSLKIAVDHVLAAPESRCLRPIFILDPDILKWLKVGPNRWRFLQQSLIDLDRNLRTINSRLFIVKSGSPSTVFKRIFGEWNVTTLTYETDIEPYAVKRDEQINEMAKEFSIKIISVNSHTIYDPHLINQRNNNQPIITLRKFISLAEGVPIAEPIPVPDSVPSESKPDADSFERNDGNCYNCPTLTELGVEESSLGECLFPGGETEGLKRLAESLKDEKWVCAFEKPNTHPNSLTPSTTVLSPYLKFGCLSSRLFYKQLKQVYARHKIHSKPPVSLEAQLLWREFYYCASLGSPNFDKMENNKICMQIDWQENKDHLECWTWGRTGYPFIDAIMRQLRQEGWVHHLARHAVACFLTRGDLYISWEEGQKVFEELLLDADWALNAGNWMWLSASAFFHQFFRVYSPVAFGKKTDPDGKYIRKYVPELKAYPKELIYEPWKASLVDQQAYKCVIGCDYPSRIVVHEDVSKVNIGRMSAAYRRNRNMKTESNSEASTSSTIKSESKAGSKRKRPSAAETSEMNSLSKYFKKGL